ncbi:hypothetical protein [Neobacillus niacini]|uniref:hypothetical protein n=1 Tax=Neobacillus niacini TaxID=86668 RepID=UPI00285DBF27|nr:hypothetical protein [Neobacillus niacini]MDR6999535.1 hypothetical protein [Neobacillus niacini]
MVSLPERVGMPVKREKQSGFIARTSWYARKKGKAKWFHCPNEWIFPLKGKRKVVCRVTIFILLFERLY